jgi:S1-C subfamily serine protease
MGRQPEEQPHPRGFLGLEWLECADSGRREVCIRNVLEGSPAAKAGLQSGDFLLEIKGQAVNSIKAARTLLGEVQPSDKIPILVRRGPPSGRRELKLELIAGEGL